MFFPIELKKKLEKRMQKEGFTKLAPFIRHILIKYLGK